jgi:hypothetical protein
LSPVIKRERLDGVLILPGNVSQKSVPFVSGALAAVEEVNTNKSIIVAVVEITILQIDF